MAGYVPHNEKEKKLMLEAIGIDSIDELFTDIPAEIRLTGDLDLPPAMSEIELVRHMGELSRKNTSTGEKLCFLGAGAYDHYVPSVVKHLVQRSEFYTAYTPYQAEVSQGTLQSIFEFQSMICELTGMDVANASMYDGATAVAEAAIMACRVTGRKRVLVSEAVHPEYRQVLRTYARGLQLMVEEIAAGDGRTSAGELEKTMGQDVGCVIVQNPNFFGIVEDGPSLGEIIHRYKALYIVCADPISLGLLKAPGDYGADIVVGEAQGLGNSLNFGGPYVGFFATRKKYMRKMPGRIVGQTVDREGKRGFVLTIQAREQHIRREKATSNICSNEALCALAATIYLSCLGRQGLRQVAELCLQKARYAYERLTELEGVEPVFTGPFFKEFVIKTKRHPGEVNEYLLQHNIIGGLDLGRFYPRLSGGMLFCVTEARSREDIDYLVDRMGALK
ncbi:MAG: aminomethyl-transferring glycine dehydrogenase subunit GcvPA [Peptococcaceae bacterium]|nr:aminomethyl-transferring glycine dehydrogenase subunit GcvPA [Peptococcaceae bacterium]